MNQAISLNCISSISLLDRLKDRKLRTEQELSKVEKAIEALEKNPDLAVILEAVSY